MGYKIGSARIDEKGHILGGKAGDQKQASVPDYKGEVSMQDFYIHKKGWYILRPKKDNIGEKMAKAMKQACNNPNIGYNQSRRLDILKYGTLSKVKTECDCSSLVRQCIIEASGKDVGNFTTANEAHTLIGSSMFDRLSFNDMSQLKAGDVLVTKSKGHTAIVTEAYLQKGSKGDIVRTLQKMLNKALYRKKILNEDGDFGNLTLSAVVSYQALKGLKKDGLVGYETWTELKREV